MLPILDINESWSLHTPKEIEEFIKKSLKEMASSSGSSGGDSGIAPMIIEGTFDGETFTPASGQPSFGQACAHFAKGGTVLLSNGDDTFIQVVACAAGTELVAASIGDSQIGWSAEGGFNPDTPSPNPNK